jgi:spermidine synthase
VISTCGLVYELISGTLASYLLGDSVTQFSTIIGVYLFSMGIGSYLSGHIEKNLIRIFVQVELLIGLIGGTSSAVLFLSFEHVASFRVLLYALISIIGILVGLEIPLMMRILQSHFEFKDLVSKIFTFDYVGALIGSILFPLYLVPHLGLVRSGFFFGILNIAVALWTLMLFGRKIVWAKFLRIASIALLAFLLAGFILSDRIMTFAEASTYPDKIVFAESSPYQRIVLTLKSNDLRLFLNSNLQFSSRDEYRYHEALVHLGLQAVSVRKNILILGGGDGMAVREALKYPDVEKITLVDLDPEMTRLFRSHADLVQLNHGSLLNPKVTVINADAFTWLRNYTGSFDFVIVDFPDPSNYSLGKLFSTTFYRELYKKLAPEGAAVIQATSPFVARKSYWCIDATLRAVGFETLPYHAYIPAFGEWGFVLASRQKIPVPDHFLPGLKFVNPETARGMIYFPQDMGPVTTDINRLNNQVLVQYFEEEWSEYAH